jgi:hypothetical protein
MISIAKRAALLTLCAVASLGLVSTPATANTATADPSATPRPVTSPRPAVGGTPRPSPTPNAQLLADIQQHAATAISNRLTALQSMTNALDSRAGVTASDKSTLLGQIQAEVSGLTALAATIKGDATAQQAFADAQRIVTDYRVYLLMGPKVHLVIAADTETGAEAKLAALFPQVQQLIDGSKAAVDKKADAQSALDDCESKNAAGQHASGGVSASVIGLEPSGYPGNAGTLTTAHDNVAAARADLGACRTDLQRVKSDLGVG